MASGYQGGRFTSYPPQQPLEEPSYHLVVKDELQESVAES